MEAQSSPAIVLANPRGTCAGVDRAIDIVNRLIDTHGAPIYVRKHIVHNRQVVKRLSERGAIFVEEVDEVPRGAVLVFSAHGISPAVRDAAQKRELRTVDATCPLVTKVHTEARKFAAAGMHIILIGDGEHDEIIGTAGEIPHAVTVIETQTEAELIEVPDPARVAVLTQTTFSIDQTRDIMRTLYRRFPELKTPPRDDICYAAQNRQDAVRELAAVTDVVLVVGSPSSHGAGRLRALAEQLGRPAYLLDHPDQLDPQWIAGKMRIGVTAWASAPEYLTQSIVKRINARGTFPITEIGVPEPAMVFTMPREISLL